MNDLIYNEIVATPGFELEFAVGTTYSVDAEVFFALSLSFARLGEDVSDEEFNSPFRMLQGAEKAMKKIALFCNRGGLAPPKKVNRLYAMLDKCIFEVYDKHNKLANFHPKLWIIKERSLSDPEERQIKLIVLSRNLTKDSSLDIAVAMTAPLGVKNNKNIRRKHEPLKSLLLYLAQFADRKKKKKISALAADLDSLGSFKLTDRYDDYDFIPLLFGENLNRDIDIKEQLPGRKMIVVSPFLDKNEPVYASEGEKPSVLEWLNDYGRTSRKVLITRMESLTPEIMDLYSGENREVWAISPLAVKNDIMPVNLHAKMYFSHSPREGGEYLWLGSSNATHNGFYRNSEFLLRLKLRKSRGQFDKFYKEYCDEEKQLFKRVEMREIDSNTVKEDHTLSIQVRSSLISSNNLSATVQKADTGYVVRITARRFKNISGTVSFAPIQHPFAAVEMDRDSKECILHVDNVMDLSEWYILSVRPFEDSNLEPIKMSVRIPTSGIPDDRDARIFKSIIDSEDKFLKYIELMVSDNPMELTAQFSALTENGYRSTPAFATQVPVTIYESLLKTVYSNPEKLRDIRDFIEKMNPDVVPRQFDNISKMFEKILKKLS